MQLRTIRLKAQLCDEAKDSAVQCSAVQCSKVQYSTFQSDQLRTRVVSIPQAGGWGCLIFFDLFKTREFVEFYR